MFTYSFFRNPRNGSLHLRLINNRRKAEMEIGLSATEEEFSDVMSSKPKTANARLALTLKNIESKVREVQMDIINSGLDQNMDVKEIRSMVREITNLSGKEQKEKNDPLLLLPFIYKVIGMKNADGTKKLYKETIRKLEKFCHDKESGFVKDPEKLRLDEINIPWLTAFNSWLASKGLSVNSRARFLRNIRTVINHAIDEELIIKYPFRRYKIQTEETPKRSMSIEDLRTLFNYPVKDYQKIYVDMFKLSFMLIGMNPKDMFDATFIRAGRIEYRRAKTRKLYSIKVEPEAMEIIERWKGKGRLLCLSERWKLHSTFIRDTDLRLKKIGPYEKTTQKTGYGKVVPLFPDVSLYWARHTWATIARKIGISVDDIALCLGHSSGHNVTRIYIDEDRDVIDRANRRVLDYVLYGKE